MQNLQNKAIRLREFRNSSKHEFRLVYESLNFMLLGLYGLVNSDMYVQIHHLLYILHSPHINKLQAGEHTPTLVCCT